MSDEPRLGWVSFGWVRFWADRVSGCTSEKECHALFEKAITNAPASIRQEAKDSLSTAVTARREKLRKLQG